MLVVAAALAGCTTDSIDDLAPMSAYPAAPAAPASSAATASGPVDTGQFPNHNIEPGSAAVQLTEEEVTAKKDALKARQAAAATIRSGPTVDAAHLKQLGQTHAADALKVIEGN